MKHFSRKTLVTTTFGILVLQGCASINPSVNEDIAKNQTDHKSALHRPLQLAAPVSRVREVTGVMMPVTEILSAKEGKWLKQLQVQLDIRTPTPMTAIIQKLAGQGINITSDLQLDSYSYMGKINPTDATTALQIILGSVGLDYKLDDSRKLVQIKPLTSKTWYLNIGNRKSSYSSDGQASNGGQNPSSTPSPNSSDGANGMGASANNASGNNAGGPATSASSSSAKSNTSSGSTSVASSDDFWSSLSKELTNRLTIMVPGTPATSFGGGSPVPPPQFNAVGQPGVQVPSLSQQPFPRPPTPTGQTTDLYVKKMVGTFALNPETGAVTIQAPHWLLQDFDSYFVRVQDMYNTDITFSGELVLLTNKRSDSQGLDLAAFATWAGGKYAAVISNNALGGITMSLPGNGIIPTLAATSQQVGGALAGFQVQNTTNAMNVFNAYLAEHGKVSVIQRPLITTTSGVPGIFSKKYTDYYNTVSQQSAAGGTGSAATATQNTLVPVELGTELKINPRIDISTGLIRAQLNLNQSIQSGTKNIPQTITFGNNAASVTTSIPLITRQTISGEILLRDGDLIVVGGQTEDNANTDENGLPGQDGPIGGVFGVKKASRGAQTYYFALRVSVSKRN